MRPALPIRLASLVLLFSFAGALAVATTAVVSACSDGSSPDPGASADGGGGSPSPSDTDAGTSDPETGSDAGTDDASTRKDANGSGAKGADCAFNRDCQAALRCECSEDTGCGCQPGARGTGRNGIDACDSGDQCASSICVDGPTNGEQICSDECQTPDDCGGELPRCIPVFWIPAPICARDPQ